MKQDLYLKDNWPVQFNQREKTKKMYIFSSGMDVDHWETSKIHFPRERGKEGKQMLLIKYLCDLFLLSNINRR
jgi:hypothetical protein